MTTKFYTAKVIGIHTKNAWNVVKMELPSGKTFNAITKKEVSAPLNEMVRVVIGRSEDGKATYFNGHAPLKRKETAEAEAPAEF